MCIPLLALIDEKEGKKSQHPRQSTLRRGAPRTGSSSAKSGTEPKALSRGLEKMLLRPLSGPC